MQSPLSILSAWIAVLMVPVIDASPRMYAAQETGQKPHVVLILADDLGWSDLACYGSDLHETPHLDALAKDGFRFTHAYAASPVCSPTRASLLTGRHPARLDMTIWRESAKNRGNRSLLEPITRDALPLSEKTLAEYLKQAGYYTANVGKWHLGRGAHPQPHGFDVIIGGTLWGHLRAFSSLFGDSVFSGLAIRTRSRTGGAGRLPDGQVDRKGDGSLGSEGRSSTGFSESLVPFGSYAY